MPFYIETPSLKEPYWTVSDEFFPDLKFKCSAIRITGAAISSVGSSMKKLSWSDCKLTGFWTDANICWVVDGIACFAYDRPPLSLKGQA